MKNESVKAFKKRRFNRLMARMDADDDEGRWITTENGHKVHINAEGEPDMGNSHVLAAMKGEGGGSASGKTGKESKNLSWSKSSASYLKAQHKSAAKQAEKSGNRTEKAFHEGATAFVDDVLGFKNGEDFTWDKDDAEFYISNRIAGAKEAIGKGDIDEAYKCYGAAKAASDFLDESREPAKESVKNGLSNLEDKLNSENSNGVSASSAKMPKVGTKFKNANGATITVDTPTKDGRVQYKIGDEVSITTPESFENIIKSNGYEEIGGSSSTKVPSKPTMQDYRHHPWGKDENADKEMTKNAMRTGGPVAREAMGDVINNLDIDFDNAGMDDLEFADKLMGDFADTGYLDTLRDEWGDDYPFTVGGWRSRNWSQDNEEADTKFAELCYKYGDRRTKAEVVGNLEEVVEEGFRDKSELKPWEKEALGMTGRNSSSASRSSAPRTTAQSVSKLNEMTGGFYGNRQDIYDDLKDNGFSYEDFGEYISVFDNNNPQDTEFVLKLGGTEHSITIDDVRAEKAPDSDDDWEPDDEEW